MKNKIVLLAALTLSAGSVNASGLFEAGLKPKPNLTLFGQKITWPIPTLCVGGKTGGMPDANVSSDGVSVKIPYLAIDLPFPSLTLKAGKDKPAVTVKIGAIEKSEQKPSK